MYGSELSAKQIQFGRIDGTTEPWMVQVACSLLVGIGASRVFEIGTSRGITSLALCLALNRMGGGHFIGCDPNGGLLQKAVDLITEAKLNVDATFVCKKSLNVIAGMPNDSIDFVWQDGSHFRGTVEAELEALKRVVRPGGIVCGHDIFGEYNLEGVYKAIGGYELNLPGPCPSWGIGIWQRSR